VNKEECCFLVLSCDAYADIWPVYFGALRHYWPQNPFPLYLASGQTSFEFPDLLVLHTKADLAWGEALRQHLCALPSKYVLLTLEDFILRGPVDTQAVLDALEFLKHLDGRMVRLVSRPGPTAPLHGTAMYGQLEVGSPYRVSAQSAIWNREALLELVESRDTPWEFETGASLRASKYATGFYCVFSDILPYGHHAVEKGQWFPWEVKRLQRLELPVDLERRSVLKGSQLAWWLLRKSKSLMLDQIPWRLRLHLRRHLSRRGSDQISR
jgi:hypothetical protein